MVDRHVFILYVIYWMQCTRTRQAGENSLTVIYDTNLTREEKTRLCAPEE